MSTILLIALFVFSLSDAVVFLQKPNQPALFPAN